MMVELADAILIIISTLLAVLFLYLCARIVSKAWYKSKKEEELSAVKRIKNHFKNAQ